MNGGAILQTSGFKISFPAVELKQALTDIIESIAIENIALGHILSAESEMLDRAKNNVNEYLGINESINSILSSIAILQQISHYELEDSENLLKQIIDLSEYDDMEE